MPRAAIAFRNRYLRTETLVDFYCHAVNTRTSPELGATLRACDLMARRSMELVLEPLRATKCRACLPISSAGSVPQSSKPACVCGTAARETCPTVVKITFHNRWRPTALIHETGHRIAHLLKLNDELASTLESGLGGAPVDVRKTWASWASAESRPTVSRSSIRGSIRLCAQRGSVVGGTTPSVFRFIGGDPHPIAFLLLFGVEMCVRSFGTGPSGTTWARRGAKPTTRVMRRRLCAR